MSDEEITRPCGRPPPRNRREAFLMRCREEDRGFETPCWIWLWSLDREGYGRFGKKPKAQGGVEMRAYRWGYLEFVGPAPKGLHLHHRCEQRECVNPYHLEPVTCRENLLASKITAASVNAAKTHCKRGHLFDKENTYIEAGRGNRQCRTCNREYMRRRRAEAAA